MIRVFALPTGEKLYTFTRGIKNTTQYFLNFSKDSQFLLSSSDSGTIHVFQLESTTSNKMGADQNSIDDQGQVKVPKAKASSWFNLIVPKACDDYIHSQKSVVSVNHNQLVQRINICAINFQNTEVFSFTQDGEFFSFQMDVAKMTLKFSQTKRIEEFLT